MAILLCGVIRKRYKLYESQASIISGIILILFFVRGISFYVYNYVTQHSTKKVFSSSLVYHVTFHVVPNGHGIRINCFVIMPS